MHAGAEWLADRRCKAHRDRYSRTSKAGRRVDGHHPLLRILQLVWAVTDYLVKWGRATQHRCMPHVVSVGGKFVVGVGVVSFYAITGLSGNNVWDYVI